MAAYMGSRIVEAIYTYDYVVSKRPELKAKIDEYLISQNRTDLISS